MLNIILKLVKYFLTLIDTVDINCFDDDYIKEHICVNVSFCL